MGSIAGAAADTWASEVGSVIFSSSSRRLKVKEEDIKKEKLVMCRLVIWPMKKVPRGTNGGVSMGGLVASCVGSFVVTIVSLITLYINGGISFQTSEDWLKVRVFIISLTLAGRYILYNCNVPNFSIISKNVNKQCRFIMKP